MEVFRKRLQSILRESIEVDEDHVFKIINTSLPKIQIEVPQGSIKIGWGKESLPFDYGCLPEFINPADNMGWDIIIPPDSQWNQPGLKVAGVVRYKEGKNKKGNDKIILSFNGHTTQHDKNVITKFFKKRTKWFKEPEFFDTRSVDKKDDQASTHAGWEAAFFKQYKLTRVNDPDYVGMGVGAVARRSFKGTWGKKEDRRR
jgi:hypothetical protein